MRCFFWLGVALAITFVTASPAHAQNKNGDSEWKYPWTSTLEDLRELEAEVEKLLGFQNCISWNRFKANWGYGPCTTVPCLIDRALEITRNLPNEDQVHPLSSIAIAQAKSGDMDAAKKTLSTAEEILYDGGVSKNVWSSRLKEIVVAQIKMGEYSEAFRAADQITESDVKNDAYGAIVEAQSKAKDFKGALNTVRKINEPEKRDKAYKTIALDLAKAGKFDKALSTVELIQDTSSRDEFYYELTDREIRAKHTSNALLLTGKITNRPMALPRLAEIKFQAGKIDDSKQALAEAFEKADQIKEPIVQVRVLAAIALAQKRMGQEAKANQTLAKSFAIIEEDSDFTSRTISFGSIAQYMNRNNDSRWAKKAISQGQKNADKISEEMVRVLYATWLAEQSKKIGDIQEGKKAIDRLVDGIKNAGLVEGIYLPLISRAQANFDDSLGAYITVKCMKGDRIKEDTEGQMNQYTNAQKATLFAEIAEVLAENKRKTKREF